MNFRSIAAGKTVVKVLNFTVIIMRQLIRNRQEIKNPAFRTGFRKDRQRHTLPQKLQYHLRKWA